VGEKRGEKTYLLDQVIWKSKPDHESSTHFQRRWASERHMADIDALKRLQGRFRRMPTDLYATKITENNTPTELGVLFGPAEGIRVENGPWLVSGHSKYPELREEFLRCAKIAALHAGYQGNTPITYWLNRICPNNESSDPTLDLRRASADQCEILIIEAENPAGRTNVDVELQTTAQKPCSAGESGSPERLAREMGTKKRRIEEHKPETKQPEAAPAILWNQRGLFLNETARIPEVNKQLWGTLLNSILPLYQKLGTVDRIRGVLQKDHYADKQFPPEVRDALDGWAHKNGYSDEWFKNVGAIQLYYWSVEPNSRDRKWIFIPSQVFSGVQDGVLTPARFDFFADWTPFQGETWSTFAKKAREEFEAQLANYRDKWFNINPSLKLLRVHKGYKELAKYQAAILPGPIDETTWQQIRRASKQLRVTLRQKP
jgi:hypothetical protein